MIARTKPEPDDGPDPEPITPARLAREFDRLALQACRLRQRLIALSIHVRPEEVDYQQQVSQGVISRLVNRLAVVADDATNLGAAIRVGEVRLDERYLDPSCRPDRPLLDRIEAAPLDRRAAEVAPAIARGGTWRRGGLTGQP